jgi:uncharacterized Tic20 family protein
MPKALKIFHQFLKRRRWAIFIAYRALLGILSIPVIATIGLLVAWVSKQ